MEIETEVDADFDAEAQRLVAQLTLAQRKALSAAALSNSNNTSNQSNSNSNNTSNNPNHRASLSFDSLLSNANSATDTQLPMQFLATQMAASPLLLPVAVDSLNLHQYNELQQQIQSKIQTQQQQTRHEQSSLMSKERSTKPCMRGEKKPSLPKQKPGRKTDPNTPETVGGKYLRGRKFGTDYQVKKAYLDFFEPQVLELQELSKTCHQAIDVLLAENTTLKGVHLERGFSAAVPQVQLGSCSNCAAEIANAQYFANQVKILEAQLSQVSKKLLQRKLEIEHSNSWMEMTVFVKTAEEMFGPVRVEFVRYSLKSLSYLKESPYVDIMANWLIDISQTTEHAKIIKGLLSIVAARYALLSTISNTDYELVCKIIETGFNFNKQHIEYMQELLVQDKSNVRMHTVEDLAGKELPEIVRGLNSGLKSVESLQQVYEAVDEFCILISMPRLSSENLLRRIQLMKMFKKLCECSKEDKKSVISLIEKWEEENNELIVQRIEQALIELEI
ncbi:hypothetical protein HK100_000871 [Physocladia obscura]|uniref:Uncharacterized protein n=1 Tax=Physocladia obscura TaxID=109957 RepID=A0AAD5SXQ0_9FUNG|nr:hypothetical protein HK100_000871 [Physocladia obscura]